MNEEICCITNARKMAKNEWENDFDFFSSFMHCIWKIGQFFFHTLLANLFKKRYTSSVTGYKYLNKLINEV